MADCAAGAAPSYGDITYVAVGQSSLTGMSHPWFAFEGTRRPRFGSHKESADVSLTARRAVPFLGNFVAEEPQQAFSAIVAVLERRRFFDMRMTAPYCCYIDGPEDGVTVVRCGVTTTLGTIGKGGEVRLDDARGEAFFGLEDELRKVIFAQKWTVPTPPPE
jgi:hypothetical protein